METTNAFPPPIDLMVLSLLARRPAHGYAIIEHLRAASGGRLDLPEGTIYPALYRLERAGLLASEAHRVAGRTRRTYRATAAGRAALRQRRGAWEGLIASVAAVLGPRTVADHG